MADQVASKGGASGSKGASPVSSDGTRKRAERRQYSHTMTEGEKFALQSVLKAKNALTAIAVHIQEGKGCNPYIVKACLSIQSEAADVLFA